MLPSPAVASSGGGGGSGTTTFVALTDISASLLSGNAMFTGYTPAGISGISITAFGITALASNTGNANTAVGTMALRNNVGGASNLGLGYSAASGNTSGNSNVAVGIQALDSNQTGSTNIAIGPQAMQNGTAPSSNIAIGGTAARNVTGNSNIVIGIGTSPLSNSANNQLNIGNTIWGSIYNANGTDSNKIGINIQSPTTSLALGALISSAGTNPLCWNSANGAVTFASTCTVSDENLKTNIGDYQGGIDRIMQLRPRTYYWKDTVHRGAGMQIGFIAQEVSPVIPQMVTKEDDGSLSFNADKLHPDEVLAIQQLVARVQALEEKQALIQ